jgi:hypothetical protein
MLPGWQNRRFFCSTAISSRATSVSNGGRDEARSGLLSAWLIFIAWKIIAIGTKTLEAAKLMRKVTYHFIPCDCTDVDEPANHAYANVAKTIQDNSLDFALVDGNIRAPCMQIIIAKIKTGGLLILDNANRFIPNRHLDENTTVHEPRFEPRTVAWRGIIDQLETWRWINTTNGIWDTRFWIKAPPPPNDRCKRANHDTLLNGERKFHDQDRPLS